MQDQLKAESNMITQNKIPVTPPPPGVGASNSAITYLSDDPRTWEDLDLDFDVPASYVWYRAELLVRAYRAYKRPLDRAWQQSGSSAAGSRSPTPDRSFTHWHNNATYIVIGDYDGPCAVYRLDNKNKLKRLKRWPREIDEAFGD